jgi:magnesium-protoporphyrin O-methyltransferase
VLDAGCGTGAMTEELARRGAEVVAIDISPQLVDIAQSGSPRRCTADHLHLRRHAVPRSGAFDHVMAMDSMIYYTDDDLGQALAGLAKRVSTSIVFTVAPRTPFLMAFFTVGKLFPRSDRSPTMIPHSPKRIAKKRLCTAEQGLFPRSSASAAASTSPPAWSTAHEHAQAHIDPLPALRGCRQR